MKQKAFFAVFLCAMIAGYSGIMIKAMTSLNATSIAWLRTGVPAIILGGWMATQKIPLFRGNYKKLLVASLLNAIRMYLFMVAYIYTSIANAAILFYFWPIFATVLGFIVLKEKIKSLQIGLLIIAFVGLLIAYSGKTFTFEDKDFIGMLASVLSAFMYAVTVIIFKAESQNYERNELIFYQNLIGALLFLPFFIWQFPHAEIPHLGIGVFYGFLIGIVAFNLFFYGLKYLKASTASSIMYLEVVSAIVLSYLILGDQLTNNMIVGGSLILVSSFLLNRVKG